MSFNKNAVFSEPLHEDTVYCTFYSLSLLERSQWVSLCDQINETILTLSKDYIWHRDVFKVFLPLYENKNLHNYPMHLISVTCFGDNIEDEWFIVYLVKNITKLYTNIVVQIKDSDGEFLLIEAANYLPSWANSNTTENRVFIYNNNLHIIPPHVASIDEKLEISEALKYLEINKDTKSTHEIENAISLRIEKFSKHLSDYFHTSVVRLPIEVATLLKLEPQYIANFINAYCNHEESKSCPVINYENLVDVPVKFTKFLYAILMQSKPIKHFSKRKSTNDKSTLLGLKISYGYQIITNSSNEVFLTNAYNKFIATLRNNGYFKGNLEGSRDYQQLLEKAKDYFLNTECSVSSNASYNIAKTLSSENFTQEMENIKNNSTNLDFSDDNDDWMTIHPDELNNTLNSRYGQKSKFTVKSEITPESITKDLNNFLNNTSNFEGIESEYTDNNTIEFEADEFQSCIEKFLGLLTMNQNDVQEESDLLDDEDCISENGDITEELEEEMKSKLGNDDIDSLHNQKNILQNFLESIKEEKAASGPSSNLLQSIGLRKTELLDSDDDDDDNKT